MKKNDNRDWETAQAVLESAARAALRKTPRDEALAEASGDEVLADEMLADEMLADEMLAEEALDGVPMDETWPEEAPFEHQEEIAPRGDEPRRTGRARHTVHIRRIPRRAAYEFEPLPLVTFGSWQGMDFLTLCLGAALIVGMFAAVARGISWVILPGATALVFAMITTQLRWERMCLVHRLQWQRTRRMAAWTSNGRLGREGTGTRATGTGGIVQLPGQRRRRTG